MNRTHTYLFVVEDGLATRYKVRPGTSAGPEYELVPYSKGERSRLFFPEAFWTDWVGYAGYLEGDTVDFAFLADREDFDWHVPTSYILAKPTPVFTKLRLDAFKEKHPEHPAVFFQTIPYPAEKPEDLKPPPNGGGGLGDYCDEKAAEYRRKRGKTK